jgi:hypothetical protein
MTTERQFYGLNVAFVYLSHPGFEDPFFNGSV